MKKEMKKPLTVSDCRMLSAVFAATWLFLSAIFFLALLQSPLPEWLSAAIAIVADTVMLIFILFLYHHVLEENGVIKDFDLPDRKLSAQDVRQGYERMLRMRPMK